MPKNIQMIGPTGVGKPEIARRLATLANAPFVKVEAPKFTEVGYVGKDVVTITSADCETRQKQRKQLREGALDDREIELDFAMNVGVEIMSPPGMEEMGQQLRQMFQNLGGARTQSRKLPIKAARPLLVEEEAGKLINEEEIRAQAVEAAELIGFVFIDEIDKVAQRSEWGGAGVSREGVQRDLLPLVEGSTVSTKYGPIKTDHMLFIASGAFSLSKPSDLIPELQGRLPIRVELSALSIDDFKRILREPHNALTKQYVALLGTEGVASECTESGIDRLAEVACQVNERTENIGARRLHTVMERLLEKISFEAADKSGEKYLDDAEQVDNNLGSLVKDQA